MFLLLLAEPVLAKKGGQKNSAPRRGTARSQQVRKTSPAAAHRTKVVQRSQPARSKPIMGRTKWQSRGNPKSTSKPNVRRSWRGNSSRPKVGTPPVRFNASKHAAGNVNAAKRARGSFSAKRPTGQRSNTTRKSAIKPGNLKSQDAGARQARKVNRPKPSVERTTKPIKPAKRIDSVKTERIASPISKPKPAVADVATITGDRKPRITKGKTVQNNAASLTKPKRARIALKKSAKTRPPSKKIRLKSVDKIRVASRTKELAPQGRKTIRNTKVVSRTRNERVNNTTVVPDATQPLRIDRQARSGRRDRQTRWDSTTRYRDRQHRTRRVHRYEHVYRDRHDRLCHRIVWPRYRFPVYYNWGSCFTFRYVYPYHHRRYVFVSLGGYWPAHYRYSRYYWYGCHPYDWYGYYPVAREVAGDTYNYYTYNYSYGESYAPSASYQSEEGIGVVDHTTFADVRERLAQQAAEPNAPTPADTYFEEAVKAFEEGEYNTAAEKFAEAMELAPEDMVLPFAYGQALFANGQYSEAADALRSAIGNVSPEAEGVFYPRGLYAEDEVLLKQIDLLTKAAELYTSDADLQLLLGYQLLGIGEIDEALEPLQQAGLDLQNKDSAEVLLNLLEKIETEKPENADQ
jgi:hypothetical protein